jgi:hypothetical protein
MPNKASSGVLSRLNHSTYNKEYASWFRFLAALLEDLVGPLVERDDTFVFGVKGS